MKDQRPIAAYKLYIVKTFDLINDISRFTRNVFFVQSLYCQNRF